MFNHHTHIIQKGDSLETLAKQYGISTEELRRYHNTYCELPDLLGAEITRQKEIIVSKPKSEDNLEEAPKEKYRKKVRFDPNNKLVYSPINSHYKYGIMITLEEGEDKNEIKYEASVKWIRKYENDHILEIDRISKMYINEEETNDIVDVLADKTSRVLYPMQLLVDENGNWIDTLQYNHYPERWKNIKNDIRKKLEGEMVDEYLSKIENILAEPEQIDRYISGDFLLRTLFIGYCTEFGKGLSIERSFSFPVIANANDPNYKVKIIVDPYLDDYNLT